MAIQAEGVAPTGPSEEFLTPKDVAKLLRVSQKTVIRYFQDEPGVVQLARRRMLRGARPHITLRIPPAVFEKWCRRNSVSDHSDHAETNRGSRG